MENQIVAGSNEPFKKIPKWWNGRHPALKMLCSNERASSNLALGTISVKHAVKVLGIKILIANVSSERGVKLGWCITSRFQKHNKNYYLQY